MSVVKAMFCVRAIAVKRAQVAASACHVFGMLYDNAASRPAISLPR